MKPSTFKEIQERLLENMRFMNDENTDHDEYNLMLSENETMGWICLSEGKGKAFEEYEELIRIELEDQEQNG